MRDPSIGIKDILESAGIGTFGATAGWGIFLGEQPAAPHTAIVINRAGGRNPFPHLLLNQPSIQIIVRGSKGGYLEATNKMDQVVNKLLGLTDIVFTNGDEMTSCVQLGDVFYMGLDDGGRSLFSSNFSLIIVPATGTNRQAF